MSIKNEMEMVLYEMEKIAELFNIDPFDIYFLGGSACILGDYTVRATRDFDFIDLDYAAALGKVFVHLKDFDMLEYESTLLSPNYQKRAKKLEQFKYLNIYVLSKEDIIVSKLIRMAEKDIEDIDVLIQSSDKTLINCIISEVEDRNDLYETKKEVFLKNVPIFKERYNV